MDSIYKVLKWESSNRYYIIRLQKNLFGEWTVIKEWGGLRNRLGGSKVNDFTNLEDAVNQINNITKTRKSRGYFIVE